MQAQSLIAYFILQSSQTIPFISLAYDLSWKN